MAALPDWLRPFFWDHDFERLDCRRDRHLVIERLLTRGTWESQKWLRRAVTDAVIRGWIIDHRARALSPRQVTFWQLVLDLPAPDVSAWLAEKAHSPWFTRNAREASP